jgi:chaperonin cofactor prefoldin
MMAMRGPPIYVDGEEKAILDYLETKIRIIETRLTNLEKNYENMEVAINDDVHEHVKTLVASIQALEKELAELKSSIKFPVRD